MPVWIPVFEPVESIGGFLKRLTERRTTTNLLVKIDTEHERIYQDFTGTSHFEKTRIAASTDWAESTNTVVLSPLVEGIYRVKVFLFSPIVTTCRILGKYLVTYEIYIFKFSRCKTSCYVEITRPSPVQTAVPSRKSRPTNMEFSFWCVTGVVSVRRVSTQIRPKRSSGTGHSRSVSQETNPHPEEISQHLSEALTEWYSAG